MKVAIASQSPEMSGQVDPRFGRAAYFIIADTEDDTFNAVDNRQNASAPQGAGIQSAQTVVNQGVGAVITGHCGPKAFHVLNAAGVRVCSAASGTVSQALEEFKAGTLEQAAQADVEGRWV